jgi:hypothetical protein
MGMMVQEKQNKKQTNNNEDMREIGEVSKPRKRETERQRETEIEQRKKDKKKKKRRKCVQNNTDAKKKKTRAKHLFWFNKKYANR